MLYTRNTPPKSSEYPWRYSCDFYHRQIQTVSNFTYWGSSSPECKSNSSQFSDSQHTVHPENDLEQKQIIRHTLHELGIWAQTLKCSLLPLRWPLAEPYSTRKWCLYSAFWSFSKLFFSTAGLTPILWILLVTIVLIIIPHWEKTHVTTTHLLDPQKEVYPTYRCLLMYPETSQPPYRCINDNDNAHSKRKRNIVYTPNDHDYTIWSELLSVLPMINLKCLILNDTGVEYVHRNCNTMGVLFPSMLAENGFQKANVLFAQCHST